MSIRKISYLGSGSYNASDKRTLTLRILDELKQRLERMSAQQPMSINQLAVDALPKEVAELETSEHLRRLVAEMDKKRFFAEVDCVLSEVPDRPILEWYALLHCYSLRLHHKAVEKAPQVTRIPVEYPISGGDRMPRHRDEADQSPEPDQRKREETAIEYLERARSGFEHS